MWKKLTTVSYSLITLYPYSVYKILQSETTAFSSNLYIMLWSKFLKKILNKVNQTPGLSLLLFDRKLIASFTFSYIRFSDIFSKHMKWFLLTLMVLAAGFYLWFTLILNGWAPNNTGWSSYQTTSKQFIMIAE